MKTYQLKITKEQAKSFGLSIGTSPKNLVRMQKLKTF